MHAHRTIAINQTLDLPDGTYRVAGWTGGCFKLRDELTGEASLLHHTELARLLPPGDELAVRGATDSPIPTLAQELDALSDDDRVLIPHLQELIDGTPAVGTEPRPEYDLSIPKIRRRGAKLLELHRAGIPISERTLQRRLDAYQKHGAAGLRDRRQTRAEKPLSRLDSRVRPILIRLLNGYRGQTATSYTAIRAELNLALADEFPLAADRPPTPSLSSIERYVKQLCGDQNPTLPGRQRQSSALRPQRTFAPRFVLAPGDECQVDTTVFDAYVRMPDGEIARPHLTTLVDARTRTLVSFNFTSGAPSGDDHARLIARALVPAALRPWSRRYAEYGLPEMPWAAYMASREHDFDTHRPYIVPRRILIDNAKDLRSEAVLSACRRYGMDLTEAPPKTPTTKAHVERMFRTISTMFARHLPGYVGGDTNVRGDKAEDAEPLELRTVVDLFDQWVATVWQNREHEGLTDPFEPSLTLTPNAMYAATLEHHGHFMLPLGEQDYIALMPYEKRTVQTDGIELYRRKYDSPLLAPMRLQKDDRGGALKVHVHYDPSDITQVWVRSTEDDEWITCGWTEEAGLARPHERKVIAAANRFAKANRSFKNDEAHLLAVEMRNEAAQEQTDIAPPADKKPRAASSRKQKLQAVEPVRERVQTANRYADVLDVETL